MKSTIYISVIILTILFTIPSCQKEVDTAPVITLVEPADNETIGMSDELHIEGDATDDQQLHEMRILLTHDNDTVYANYPTVHGQKTFHFHYHYDPAHTGAHQLQVTVTDHEGLSTTVTRTVTVTP